MHYQLQLWPGYTEINLFILFFIFSYEHIVVNQATIISSALWGVLAFNEIPRSIVLFSFGLLLLVIGVSMASFCESLAKIFVDKIISMDERHTELRDVEESSLCNRTIELGIFTMNLLCNC